MYLSNSSGAYVYNTNYKPPDFELNDDEKNLLNYFDTMFAYIPNNVKGSNYKETLRIGVLKTDVEKFLKYYRYFNNDTTAEDIEKTLDIKIIKPTIYSLIH